MRHMHYAQTFLDHVGCMIKVCEDGVKILEQHLEASNFILGDFRCREIVCNLYKVKTIHCVKLANLALLSMRYVHV